jgi:predicted ATP-dependent endonuclease of OLD family
LIYRLFRVSAAYAASRHSAKKKDFSPDFTLLLFEEPEAFLHPPQQSQLDMDLRKIGCDGGKQVMVSTHSPQFVSHAAENITGIARLHRFNGHTIIGQVRPENLDALFTENQEINRLAAGLKKYEAGAEECTLEMEAVKYFLWLNPERCGVFFAKRTLIVEGPSELILINYLIQTGKIQTPAGGLFILDAMGKFNIHRFMNLLSQLKIEHSVLQDADPNKTGDDKVMQEGVNKLIQDNRTSFTREIHLFAEDLEAYLRFKGPKQDHRNRKPSRLLLGLKEGKIGTAEVDALCKLIEELAGVKSK